MKRNILLGIIVFIISGFIFYFNIINSFFLSDDFHLIYSVKINGPFGIWSNSLWPFFRPLISLSFFVDYKLWGLNPAGYHITNIFIHSLNAFLVSIIVLFLMKKEYSYAGAGNLAFFSGLLFLIMPCHTEAVSWISGRCDVIATFLFLLSFCSYLSYKKYNKLQYLLASLLFFVLALFSKESVIIYPLVILSFELYSYIEKENKDYNLLRILYLPLIYSLLVILYIPFRSLIIGRLVGGYGTNFHLNFKPPLVINNLFLYTIRSFLFASPLFQTSIILISLGIILIFIINLKRAILLTKVKILYFLITAFLVSLIPVINIGNWTGDTQGERFIYLPTIFSSIIIVFLFNFFLRNKKYFIFSSLCLLFICGISLYNVNRNWITAGEISKSILHSIKTMGKFNRLCIINLSDNIRGAYIYRNGIKEALYLFACLNDFADIEVVLYHNIFEKKDAVIIEKLSEPDKYKVKLLNTKTLFYPINMFGRHRSNCVVDRPEIRNSLDNSFSIIKLKKLNEDEKLLFYSKGRMEQFSHN